MCFIIKEILYGINIFLCMKYIIYMGNVLSFFDFVNLNK